MRARRTVGIGVVLAIVLTLPALGRQGALARADCGPAAVVEGEPGLVRTVEQLLTERGVAVVPPAGCPTVRAHVARDGAGVRVVVMDAYGRRSERIAGDAGVAATLIESWTRSDLGAPLLAGPGAAGAPGAAAVDDEEPSVLEPVVVHVAAPPPVGLTVAAATAVGSEGSLWVGLEAAGCVTLGRLCAGAIARGAADIEVTGSSERKETARLALDVLLTADVPARWGTVTLAPGVGLGVGWLRTTSVQDLPPGVHIAMDTGGLRGEAHVRASVPLSRRLALDLGLSAAVSLRAHTAPFEDEGVDLAGEPGGFVRGAVGLRWGAP